MKIKIISLVAALLLVVGFSRAATANCPSPSNGGPVPNYASYYTIADGFFGIITYSGRNNNQIILLVDTDAIFTAGELVVIQGTINGNGILNTIGVVSSSSPGAVGVYVPGANVSLQVDDGKVYPYSPQNQPHPVTIDVTVDGETTGNTSCMGGATHPHTMETTVNGIHQSLPVPLTYSTFTSTQTLVEPVNTPIPLSVEADVNCVAMGEVFVSLSPIQVEVAYERAASTGVRSNCVYSSNTKLTKCDISAIPWCTLDSTPPDFSTPSVREEVQFMNTPIPTPRFWDIFALMIRLGPGHPWIVFGGPYGAIAVGSYNAGLPLAECTHNP